MPRSGPNRTYTGPTEPNSGSATYVRKQLAEWRRTRAVELILKQRPIPEIAAELGVSQRHVERMLKEAREDWRRSRGEKLDQLFDEDLRKLSLLEGAIIDKALNARDDTQLWAMDRMMAIIQRRAEMIGYDAPKRNMNLDLDLTSLTDEQLERIAGGEDPLAVVRSAIVFPAPQLPRPD